MLARMTHCPCHRRFAAAFYCYFTYMPSFLASNVPGMSRALSLGSTMVHLSIVMVVAWATGIFCDRGMPRMIVSAVVFIIAGASLAPAALAMQAGGLGAAWVLHLYFSMLVGVIGGLLAVSMCPLYPPEVRTSGMNFAHQVSCQTNPSGMALSGYIFSRSWTCCGQSSSHASKYTVVLRLLCV